MSQLLTLRQVWCFLMKIFAPNRARVLRNGPNLGFPKSGNCRLRSVLRGFFVLLKKAPRKGDNKNITKKYFFSKTVYVTGNYKPKKRQKITKIHKSPRHRRFLTDFRHLFLSVQKFQSLGQNQRNKNTKL